MNKADIVDAMKFNSGRVCQEWTISGMISDLKHCGRDDWGVDPVQAELSLSGNCCEEGS
jgi:hypothetical protein